MVTGNGVQLFNNHFIKGKTKNKLNKTLMYGIPQYSWYNNFPLIAHQIFQLCITERRVRGKYA